MFQVISGTRGYLYGFIYEVTGQISNTSYHVIKERVMCTVSYSEPIERS